MRAALLCELGRPPEPSDVPEPTRPGADALVEVLAAPLNPIDIAAGAGRFYGGHPPLPYVPGCEAVGKVLKSEAHAPGTLVWAHGAGLGVKRDGGLAERLVAPPEALLPLPEDADPVLAGALGIAGLAGWLPLAWRAPVRGGETVLVLGATGTVGLVAVQAARLLGAGRVVAAGRSREGLERASRAGAAATVALEEGDIARRLRDACGGEGPNLVLDPLWGEPLTAALEAAAPAARIVNVGQSAGPQATLRSAAVRGKQLELLGYSNFAAPPDVVAREYRRLLGHAAAGDVRVDVEQVPFADVSSAWRRQAEGAGCKLVVVP
jgi:NADPH:quinone reductase-like Zn-dependent oxidoreductase